MRVYIFCESSLILQQMNRNSEIKMEFTLQNINDLTFNPNDVSKKQRTSLSGDNSGKWCELQHLKYIVYMEFHKNQMRSKENRRSFKLYKQMAKFVRTRDPQQCRSHHQKLEEKYHYPNKIIANCKQHCDWALYGKVKEELLELQNRSSVTVRVENQNDEQIVRVEVENQPQNVVPHESEVVVVPPNHLQMAHIPLEWQQEEICYQQNEMLINWLNYNNNYNYCYPIYPFF